ncbi:MAG: TIR domain-containing protein [Woronichinia naegeliana WA131]|jgi:hypothetical protein|uniref:TIR domain-containing protein n=1 Tax=Woronichinia naegeliana WA131 TaxID=2824559 RepID=A0A977KSM9_9CYAN|nr:MAG: TIR domain-containing protein [Woronichinia naegeliana WA131]
MNDLQTETLAQPPVFLNYSISDHDLAQTLAKELRSAGVNVWIDVDKIEPGQNWRESIRTGLTASSYFIFLLSQSSVQSAWLNDEITMLQELQSRNITFLPVLIEDCQIPESISHYQYYDLRDRKENSLKQLAANLSEIGKINFKVLSPQLFEKLIVELLQQLGFITLPLDSSQDQGVDAVVKYRQKDPFGAECQDIYAVEAKLYRNSRVDLSSLRQLVSYVHNHPKVNKGLLVTNSNLTSVTLDWAKNAQKTTGIPLRVIEGTELKRLLLQHTDLINKYFWDGLSHAV